MFVRYWMQTLDWSYATTSSTLARSAYEARCSDCARFLSNYIDKVRAAGLHYIGGRIAVESVTPVRDRRVKALFAYDVTVTQTALKIVDASGHVRKALPASSGLVFRTWIDKITGTGWQVAAWKQAVTR